MYRIMRVVIWFNLFNIAIIGGITHNTSLLVLAIIGAYVSLKIWPIIKDKPTEDK